MKYGNPQALFVYLTIRKTFTLCVLWLDKDLILCMYDNDVDDEDDGDNHDDSRTMIQVNDAHPPYSQQFIFVLRIFSKNKRPWLRKCSLKGLKKAEDV